MVAKAPGEGAKWELAKNSDWARLEGKMGNAYHVRKLSEVVEESSAKKGIKKHNCFCETIYLKLILDGF